MLIYDHSTKRVSSLIGFFVPVCDREWKWADVRGDKVPHFRKVPRSKMMTCKMEKRSALLYTFEHAVFINEWINLEPIKF